MGGSDSVSVLLRIWSQGFNKLLLISFIFIVPKLKPKNIERTKLKVVNPRIMRLRKSFQNITYFLKNRC